MTTFSFQGREYEVRADAPLARMVELPVAWKWLHQFYGQSILEVGNVLSHWYDVSHDVLDRYEHSPAVTFHGDAAVWRPKGRYDAIVCISTIEHIGEGKPDPGPHVFKPLAAVYNMLLYSLAPAGKLLLTFPWRRRLEVDALVFQLPWSTLGFLRRTGKARWEEIGRQELRTVRYNQPYKKANAVIIGELVRP